MAAACLRASDGGYREASYSLMVITLLKVHVELGSCNCFCKNRKVAYLALTRCVNWQTILLRCLHPVLWLTSPFLLVLVATKPTRTDEKQTGLFSEQTTILRPANYGHIIVTATQETTNEDIREHKTNCITTNYVSIHTPPVTLLRAMPYLQI